MSNKVSFRDTVLAQMGNFLLGVGFRISMAATQILKKELVEVANQLSDYYEEGTHLYPEVIILDDLSQFIKEYPCIYNVFENGELKEKSLQRAIKMCAPLADNGWVIFIEVKGDNVAWGVLNVELSAVTTPVFNQIIADNNDNYQIVYIKNIGLKTVEFASRGNKNNYLVSLSLKDIEDILRDEVADFCDVIVRDVKRDKSESKEMINKAINTAIQRGHGNLIVVIEDKDEDTVIPDVLKNGVKVTPIDFPDLYFSYFQGKGSIENHSALEKNIDLIISMMNHDGITVFTTKGRVVGFHYIVENNIKKTEENEGGSRHKAYNKLCTTQQIMAVLMRSQEGVTNLFKR